MTSDPKWVIVIIVIVKIVTNHIYWQLTMLPPSLVDSIVSDLDARFGGDFHDAGLGLGSDSPGVDTSIRDSSISWVSWEHWAGAMMWGYMRIINDKFFGYDINHIDGGKLQYTRYDNQQFYTWHKDEDIDTIPENGITFRGDSENKQVFMRKLSASLILNEDFEGGQFQIISPEGKIYSPPSEKGTLIVFDSRMQHRVRPVKSGVRKSLVAWGCGPRWR